MNQALTQGRQAGATGGRLAAYTLTRGAIEGAIAGVFQRFGLGGMESHLAQARKIAEQGIKEGAKRLGVATLQELPEEVLTEVGHQIAEKVYGIDNAELLPQLPQVVGDTVVQTIMAMGATHTIPALASIANRPAMQAAEADYNRRIEEAVQRARAGINEPPPISRSMPQAVADSLATQREEAAKPPVQPVTEREIGPGVQAQLDEVRAKRLAGKWAQEHPGETPSRREWSEFGMTERLPAEERKAAAVEYAAQEDNLAAEEENLLAEMQSVEEAAPETAPETAAPEPVEELPADLMAMTPDEVESIWRAEVPQAGKIAPAKSQMVRAIVRQRETVASAPAEPAGEGAAAPEVPVAAAATDLPTFATTINDIAQSAKEGRFGENKVFISQLWNEFQQRPEGKGVTREQFDKMLVDANREDLLTLSRADLVSGMDAGTVAASEVVGPGDATHHFVRTDRPGKAGKPAVEGTPAPEVPVAEAKPTRYTVRKGFGTFHFNTEAEARAKAEHINGRLFAHYADGTQKQLREEVGPVSKPAPAAPAAAAKPAPAAPAKKIRGRKAKPVAEEDRELAEYAEGLKDIEIEGDTAFAKMMEEIEAEEQAPPQPSLSDKIQSALRGRTRVDDVLTLEELHKQVGGTVEEFKAEVLKLYEQKKIKLDDYTRAWADVIDKPQAIRAPKEYDEKRGYGLKWYARAVSTEQAAAPAAEKPLSQQQKYSVATMLATNTLEPTLARLKDNPAAQAFAKQIDKYYKRRDGFVPQKVRDLVNAAEPVAEKPLSRPKAERDALILQHQGLVGPIARKLARTNRGVEVDDLVSEGTTALIEAVDAFDQSKQQGQKFESYARRAIRNRLLDYVQGKGKPGRQMAENAPDPAVQPEAAPVEQREVVEKVESVVSQLPPKDQQLIRARFRSGHRATLKELADKAGITPQAMQGREKKIMLVLSRKLDKDLAMQAPAGGATGSADQPGMPVEMQGTGERIGAREVMERLEQIFKVPIRVGRLRGKGLRGVYKLLWGNVRVKGEESASLDVATHELAHGMDKRSTVLSGAGLQLRNEVATLDYEYPEQMRPDEGFAEYLRGYLTDEIDVAAAVPQFHAHFQQWLQNNPLWDKRIKQARQWLDRWRAAGAAGRVAGQISQTGKPTPVPLREQAPQMLHRAYQAMKDQFHFGHLFEQELRSRGYRPSAGLSFMDRAVAFNQSAATLANTALESGVFTFNPDGSVERIGQSLWEALEPITNQEYDNWVAWAYARHALESWGKEKNPGITKADAQHVYDAGRHNRHWERAADAVTKFNNDLVRVLVTSGRIAPDTGDRIIQAYQTYLPLFRVVPKKVGRKGIVGGVGLVDLPEPIRRRRGSGYQILDPVQSTVRQALLTYQVASAQIVTNEMVSAAMSHGARGWVEKVPPKLHKTELAVQEAWEKMKRDLLDQQGIDPDWIDQIEEELDEVTSERWRGDLLSIYRPDYFSQGGQPIVRVYEGGQPTLYYMQDDLYKTVTGMGIYHLPKLIDATLGAMTRLVRIGATTLNPTFVMRNFFRDMPTYLMQRNYGGAADPLRWVGTYAYSEFQRRIKGHSEDPYVKLYRQYGGLLSSVLSQDRPSVRRAVQSAVKGKQKFGVMETILDAAQFTEAGPRLAEFVGVWKKHGYTREQVRDMVTTGRIDGAVLVEALNAAHEVTVDFRRAGTVGRVVTRLIPFWNARLEGLDKTVRTWKDNPTRTFARWMGYAVIPTILYWLWHKDEDWYQERESWLDQFWVWSDEQGNPVARIPRGHEYAQLAAGIEGILDSLYRRDPDAIQRWAAQFLKNTRPDFNVSGFSTAWQLARNRDVFGRPIVPPGKEDLQAGDQAKEYNTHLMKAIGKWLDVSPAKLEHAIDTGTGGLYRRATTLAESMFSENPLSPADIPVLQGFVLRQEQPRSVNEFYVELDRVRRAYASAKLPGRKADPELVAENYRLGRVADIISDLRKLIDGVEDRDQRWEVQQYMAGLARKAIGRPMRKRYPDPLTSREAPQGVQDVVHDHVGRLATTAASIEDARKATPEKVEQMRRAQQTLRDLGVSQSLALRALEDKLVERGYKRPTILAWKRRLILATQQGE
jgi:RNA polymerase sigma factor (sigma-70 family)